MKKTFAVLSMAALLTGGMSAFSTAYAHENEKPTCLTDVPPAPVPVTVIKLCPGFK